MRKQILALAWPAVLEMLLYLLLDLVDVAFVGRLGPRALAGVGLGAQIYYSVIFVFAALATGATALVARALGAQDPERAERAAGQALLLSLFIGLGFGLLCFTCSGELVALFRFEPEVQQIAASYLRVAGTPAAFSLLLFVGNGIFRGAGFTKIPLGVAVLTNAVHIALGYVLIFGKLGFPRLGAVGAAGATAFSQALSCLVVLGLLASGKTPLRLRPRQFFRPDPALLREIAFLSIPAGLEEALLSGGRVVASFLLARLGTISFAAHQVALTAESLSYMPGYGFAVAATALVGRSLGACRPRQAYAAGWEAARLALLVMGAIGLVFLLLPGAVLGLFTRDPAVLALGSTCLRIAAFEQLPLALDMVLAGALRGAGDTRTPMLVAVGTTWLFRLPLFYLVTSVLSLGLPAVWVVAVGDWCLRAFLLSLRFRGRRWQRLGVSPF